MAHQSRDMPNNSTAENRSYRDARGIALAAARRRRPSAAGIILVIHVAVLLFLIAAGLYYYYGQFSVDSLFHPACIASSVLVVWWYWSWLAFSKEGWFDPYILFLTAAVLFNCGQPILEVFGQNEKSLLRDHFSENISLATLYLVALGISALHLGVMLSSVSSPGRNVATVAKPIFPEFHLRNVYYVGLALLLISAVPTILNMRERLQIVMTGGYASLFQQQPEKVGLAASVSLLADFLIPGIAFVIAGGMRRRIMRTVALSTVFLWTALELFAGQRAHALMPTLAMVWLWDRRVKRIPKAALVGVGLLIMCLVCPVMALTRNEAGSERLSLSRMQNAFNKIDNPLVAELSEMGFSANTIAWTLELVPGTRPFSLGGTYLSAILILVPNWSSGLHPAMHLFGYDIPDYWLTWQTDREFAARGGSYGYSFIAEAYLNFGWVAPLALFVLGAIYGRLRRWTLNGGDPAKLAVMGIFLSSVLFFARSGLMLVVRSLSWYALIPYLGIVVLDSLTSWRQVRRTGVPGVRSDPEKSSLLPEV